jgi:hypothetical protein
MINYRKVGKAIKRYEKLGYVYIDTPWLISEEAVRATLPLDREGFELRSSVINAGKLVGSAEQGFIQLMLDKAITKGRYVTAGPCFRDEPVVDAQHQYTFFKVELIDLNRALFHYDVADVREMAEEAAGVMYGLYGTLPTLKTTQEGVDLVVDGVEVGSYGLRSFQGHEWVYGTGLALPRTPQAMKVRE